MRCSSLILSLSPWFAFAAAPAAQAATGLLASSIQEDEAELEALVQAERDDADLLRRRGEARRAIGALSRLLDEEPVDPATRIVRARARLDLALYEKAEEDARRALQEALRENLARSADLRAQCARVLAELLLETGRAGEALEALSEIGSDFDPGARARDAWIFGRCLAEVGRREEAEAAFRAGAKNRGEDWRELLARGHCELALGFLTRASKSYVRADDLAKKADGVEPDVLVALADLYFEADREVAAAKARSPRMLYDEALRIHATHTGALLGMFELHAYNWRRRQRTATDILEELLEAKPDLVTGLVAGAAADLDDGKLPAVRERLARLRELAPARRDVRTMEAALAWVEHRRDDCRAILAELEEVDPSDGRPAREVGRHLLELYRFAEGVEFLERSVELDPDDHRAWQELGRALANTGREDEARVALETAVEKAAGRQDAWRDNMALVLEKMDRDLDREDHGDLAFRWDSRAGEVLRTYLVPFYQEAREEFSARYGHTASPTLIEVFDEHTDFSVRSTGFQGFPALGVCFGPVVTAVSPLSELRGSFSWARTAFHEFSHVVHLGISHNRCPRWITEGLATWEETNRNPTWSRNLRRDLIDAMANDDVIPVRDLNRAFRGPRILFGYYQGGLLCQMLIEDHGFPPMIRLLHAFDRGLDLDQAFGETFGATPEQIDERFAAFLEREYGALAVEPRWDAERVGRLRLFLAPEPPAGDVARREWVEDWTTVAWGAWQRGQKVDAQQALRKARGAGLEVARMAFLEGEIALAGDDRAAARERWKEGLALGGDDYRVRMGLGSLAVAAGDLEEGLQHYLRAEELFPGYDEEALSAELRLVDLYEAEGEEELAMAARERWLGFNAGEVEMRRRVAAWHAEHGRHEEAARYYFETNEVDLFLRDVHDRWGRSLLAAGRHEEAAREFSVARLVPPDLDADEPGPLSPAAEAELHALEAEALQALGKREEAADRARRALELDDDCERAREILDGIK